MNVYRRDRGERGDDAEGMRCELSGVSKPNFSNPKPKTSHLYGLSVFSAGSAVKKLLVKPFFLRKGLFYLLHFAIFIFHFSLSVQNSPEF